jgi:hypothetical protein
VEKQSWDQRCCCEVMSEPVTNHKGISGYGQWGSNCSTYKLLLIREGFNIQVITILKSGKFNYALQHSVIISRFLSFPPMFSPERINNRGM